MKNSNSFELLIAHDKKIGEAYKKLCMDLINNDFEQSKVSCKNILELIKIETSMLDKMTKEELEYYVDLADIIFTMDEVDDETYRASEKIVQTYMAKFVVGASIICAFGIVDLIFIIIFDFFLKNCVFL